MLSDTSAYATWWPWLRAFDPVPLEPGATTHCSIGPPLPYVLSLDLAVVDVVAEESMTVAVSGDLCGRGRLDIGGSARGSTARLAWDVEVCRPALRVAAIVGRPVLQWGHDYVVSNGVEQFRRAAIDEP
ncbi:MAG: hypothetical protein ACR2GF_07120 [Acidimicrobiales bacterium]